jgi:hypothetical protein
MIGSNHGQVLAFSLYSPCGGHILIPFLRCSKNLPGFHAGDIHEKQIVSQLAQFIVLVCTTLAQAGQAISCPGAPWLLA